MLSTVKTIALHGMEGYTISVQADVSNGLPAFDIVGLPDTSIREAKERVMAAIKNTVENAINRKIVINLAPASVKKGGSSLDLSIAIALLIATNTIIDCQKKNICLIGELLLDGRLNQINGVLAMCIEASKLGFDEVIVPMANLEEASLACGIIVKGANSLKEVCEYLQKEKELEVPDKKTENVFSLDEKYDIDFSEVAGQESAKRALEISAAGGHNVLLIGPPGAGKTMIAKRIPTILPKLTYDEALEITKIYSVAGKLNKDEPIIRKRPFRMPHYSISKASLIGGGNTPKLGEISLANNGVMFLDEFGEFKRDVLELLRGPLEDEKIVISRLNNSVTYPARFILIVAMNPCPCGYYGSKVKECSCSPQMISKYISKLSGPILDRIDLHVKLDDVKYEKIDNNNCESSCTIRERAEKARLIQEERYKDEEIKQNASITNAMIKKYCKLDVESKNLLEKTFNRLKLSMRSYTRIIKVARTIADLDGTENIQKKHIAEAASYRILDRVK